MKTYVSDLKVNCEVESYFLLVDVPQVRVSKKDEQYLVFKLVDKTGEVDARMWQVSKDLEPETLAGSIVKIRGSVSEWSGQLQVSVSKMRKIAEETDEVDIADFFERSERDPEDMFDELMDVVQTLESGFCLANGGDKLLILVSNIVIRYKESLKRAPAAKSVHHNYIGGLLEHVLSSIYLAQSVAQLYKLDSSLMVTGVILHDIGKIFELDVTMGIKYTIEGRLLGHISQGMMMVADEMRKIEKFPQVLRVSILHLIASHHGLLEWGSPKIPLMREAIALHLIDMIDSRLAICNRVLKNGLSQEGLSEFSKELGGQLFFPQNKGGLDG